MTRPLALAAFALALAGCAPAHQSAPAESEARLSLLCKNGEDTAVVFADFRRIYDSQTGEVWYADNHKRNIMNASDRVNYRMKPGDLCWIEEA